VQFNALYVRRAGMRATRWQLGAWLWCARLRYLLVRAACRLCPVCVRRYQHWRGP
jgi:hypothetical protein